MASRYVPPHRKREDDGEEAADSDVAPESTVSYQRELWQALGRSITGVVNRVSAENVADSAVLLFRENLVRGRGLLARSVMRAQQVDADLTMVLASLVSRVNKELPNVVELLCRRLVVQWNRAYLRKDWRVLESVSKFIAGLFIFKVVDVSVIYQIIVTHLTSERRTDEDIDQAAKVFHETFKAMSDRARAEFHEQVLSPFRDLLAMDDDSDRLSARAQAALERCLKAVQAWERQREETSYIPDELVVFDLDSQTTHDVDLTEKYDTEDALDRFVFDKDYTAHEEQYEAVRRVLLGDDWEMKLLEEVAAAEEEDAGDEESEEDRKTPVDATPSAGVPRERAKTAAAHSGGAAGSSDPSPEEQATKAQAALDASKTLINTEERELRKDVYLAMRSSVRADEAVHKILRQMKPQAERTVCFMVVEGCCEERSYRKMYAMAAERLCKSNARFQAFFVESLKLRYLGAEALTVKQIEYTAKIFAHLLRTESVYWGRCLNFMDILVNNESQRLLIQGLMKTLAEEMGMPALLRRLTSDEEVASNAQKLFPVDREIPAIEYAINLYTAMGVSGLAAPMRVVLEKLRSAGATTPTYGLVGGGDRKRQRE